MTIEEIIIFFEIILIDLVLAGDNAIIIGMVASQFKDDLRKKIIFWGIGAAVILRICFTLIATYLLQINVLKLLLVLQLVIKHLYLVLLQLHQYLLVDYNLMQILPY